MTFSEKLYKLRREKTYSQDDLAELLDVSRQSISKWESGQSMPETSKIIQISNIFNVSIDELLKDNIELPHEEKTDQLITKAEEKPAEAEFVFCTECGKKNRADSNFCGYCGKTIYRRPEPMKPRTITKEEMDLAYYKASLEMQQEALELQKEELREAIKQTEHEKELIRAQKRAEANKAKCPKCGSTSLTSNKKGYGLGKGLVGAAIIGPYGLLAGGIGANATEVRCLNCGLKFKLRMK